MPTDKDAKRGEFKTAAGGVGLGALTYLVEHLPIHDPTYMAHVDGYANFGYVGTGLMVGGSVLHNRWYFSAQQRLYRTLGQDGWLNQYDLRETAGARAMREHGDYLRPGLPARQGLRRQPVIEYGTCVGHLVTGPRWMRRRKVYSPHSRGVLVFGPPGGGKSTWLAHPVFDHPGGAYVTSTKTELVEWCAAVRAQRGPVWVFNPAGIGGVESTFGWDPVVGCDDQAVADARAWALVRGGGGAAGVDRADFWAQKAQEIVRCYLMAAALRGWDMGAVHYWATHPDDKTPVGILQSNPDRVPGAWIGTLETHLAASANTRTGYFATVVSCVGFMDNPQVARACRPAPGQNFDILKFLERGTLFVVGSADDKRLAPLLTALTEHIFSQAKTVAAASPGRRLANGLAMILDEVANMTPVPLDKWAADSRGWGITVMAVLQDLAQLRTTWGPDRAKTIYSSLPTKVVLPGVANRDDLEELAYLAGTRQVEKVSAGESMQAGTWDNRRSVSSHTQTVLEPVITGQTIYGLPKFHAYVLGLSPRACVIRYEPGFRRARREKLLLSRAARARKQLQLAPAATGVAEQAARA